MIITLPKFRFTMLNFDENPNGMSSAKMTNAVKLQFMHQLLDHSKGYLSYNNVSLESCFVNLKYSFPFQKITL